MSTSKKPRERMWLSTVLSADEINTPREVIDHERPDFLLKYENSVVGVEVTVLHRPDPSRGSRSWEGACESVLKMAEDVWHNRSLPPVHVSVSFNKNSRFPKNRREPWGGRLVELVDKALPEPGCQSVIGVGPPHLIAPIEPPPEVESMIVTRLESIVPTRVGRKRTSVWTLSTGGALPRLEVSTLREVISKKDRLVPIYRSSADFIWLIIGLDRYRYSSDYTFRDSPALDADYDSRFERVFLVPRGGGKHFFELNG